MVSDRLSIPIPHCADFNEASRLSKLHKDHPWGMDVNGQRYEVGYWPGDSRSGMFGGNSNWRGPICEVFFLGWHVLEF
jgi:hypothetical protein